VPQEEAEADHPLEPQAHVVEVGGEDPLMVAEVVVENKTPL
jgi:hypothetical protein